MNVDDESLENEDEPKFEGGEEEASEEIEAASSDGAAARPGEPDAAAPNELDLRSKAEEQLKQGLELPISAEVVSALRQAALGDTANSETESTFTASAVPGDASAGTPAEIRIVVEFRGLSSAPAATPAEAASAPAKPGPASGSAPVPDENHRPMSPFDPLSDDKSMPKLMPVSLPITLSNARGHIQDVVHTATPEIHKTMAEICDQKIEEFKRWLYIQDRRIFRE